MGFIIFQHIMCVLKKNLQGKKKNFFNFFKKIFSKLSKNDFYCIFLMKIDHFQHKNTEIFQIGQEIRELANWLIVQKWPLFEPKMFTVHCITQIQIVMGLILGLVIIIILFYLPKLT